MTRLTSLPAGIRRGLRPAAVLTASAALATAALGTIPASAKVTIHAGYRQVNLVSDQPMKDTLRDGDLVNAWGLAASPGTNAKPGSPLWVADNGTSKATLYAGKGQNSVTKVGLVVRTSADPTGQIFNPFPHAFGVSDGHGHHAPALFAFDTESGTIDGWSPTIGAVGKNPSTRTFVLHRQAGAVYKGLATARFDGEPVLYATNFHSGKVEAYDRSMHRASLPGRFIDPNLPAGYAPFGIAEINGNLIVTYAKQQGPNSPDEVDGPGLGFVDMFGNGGHFLGRLGTRGPLNAPWGIALAPQGFGRWSGALLIGNFGDGHINVYNPTVDRHGHLGQLLRPSGRPMVIPGLWGLMAGNGNAAKTGEVLFSAGPSDESHGLVGKFVPQVP